MTTLVDITAWTPWCTECDWQYADCRSEEEAEERAAEHRAECDGAA